MLGTEKDYGDRDGKLVKEGWVPGGGKGGEEWAQADEEPYLTPTEAFADSLGFQNLDYPSEPS